MSEITQYTSTKSGMVRICSDGINPAHAQALVYAIEALLFLCRNEPQRVDLALMHRMAGLLNIEEDPRCASLVRLIDMVIDHVSAQCEKPVVIEHSFHPYAPPTRETDDEAALVASLALHLRNNGERPRLQVACNAGIADIVTGTAVYEVKSWLNRKNFIAALGQVLLYRQAINPTMRAVIVGFAVPNVSIEPLVAYANQLGVEVLICSSQ